jgi:acyl-CoA thioesterase-1
MPLTLALVQALILLLAACSSHHRVPQLSHLATDATILAFGDSLTFGSGVTPPESYPAQLAQLTGRKVVNAGVPGEISADGRQRLATTLDDEHPDLVILCLGGNDMLRHLDKDQMKANLSGMIREIRGRGIPVVLIAVPYPTLFNLKANPVYDELAREYSLPVENELLPKILGDRSRKSDEIHPNAQGYRELAESLAKLLRDAGAI